MSTLTKSYRWLWIFVLLTILPSACQFLFISSLFIRYCSVMVVSACQLFPLLASALLSTARPLWFWGGARGGPVGFCFQEATTSLGSIRIGHRRVCLCLLFFHSSLRRPNLLFWLTKTPPFHIMASNSAHFGTGLSAIALLPSAWVPSWTHLSENQKVSLSQLVSSNLSPSDHLVLASCTALLLHHRLPGCVTVA